MDKDVSTAWVNEFTTNNIPQFVCSKCGIGLLQFTRANILFSETGESKRNYSHEAWEPDWIRKRFAGILECNNSSCNEVSIIAGESRYSVYHTDERGEDHGHDYLSIRYFSPPPRFIKIPEKCPKKVCDSIVRSFELFYTDCSACANALRTAIEYLMSAQGINKSKRSLSGKRLMRSLHERIAEYRDTKNVSIGNILLAVKWIGNSGSHESAVEHDDVLQCYEILEHALNEIYLGKTKVVARITKSILKRKGPATKRKKTL